MTSNLAKRISYFFLRHGVIQEDKIEEYIYGFELLLADVYIFFIMGCVSAIMNRWMETIVFLISFITLRRQAGGYHASSHFNCNAIFIATYLLFLLLLNYMLNIYVPIITAVGMILSIIIVIKLAPISHPNSPVSQKKYERCRKNSLKCVIVGTIITTVLLILNPILSISYMAGILSVSLYLLAQYVKIKILKRKEMQ